MSIVGHYEKRVCVKSQGREATNHGDCPTCATLHNFSLGSVKIVGAGNAGNDNAVSEYSRVSFVDWAEVECLHYGRHSFTDCADIAHSLVRGDWRTAARLCRISLIKIYLN